MGASAMPGSTDITARTRGKPDSLAKAAIFVASSPPTEWPTAANFCKSTFTCPGSVCRRSIASFTASNVFGVNSRMGVSRFA